MFQFFSHPRLLSQNLGPYTTLVNPSVCLPPDQIGADACINHAYLSKMMHKLIRVKEFEETHASSAESFGPNPEQTAHLS